MRHLVGFLFVCALVGTLPQSASAQVGEEGTTTEPNLQEPASSSEPAPEEPALQLKIDSAGVEVVPSQPRTDDGYTLEEMDLRVRRARIGLWSTAGAALVGGVMMGASVPCMRATFEDACWGPFLSGAVIGFSGAIGMIVTGAMLGKRKRKLRRLQEAEYGTPRRVQWDLAQSRLVF
ncbi:MAG: hypothetical protein JRD92_05525 [Deltaproteobacteria bacterium]|nr:hypothetical protein [Deltaproteobacteria bacterium]